MTQIASMAKAFLNGEVLSIMNCFKKFSMTNAPRECGRGIERKFGVILDRKVIDFTSKYGHKGTYNEYRLFHSKENKPGIEKMKAYISEQEKIIYSPKPKRGPKTSNPKKDSRQEKLFG